MRRYTFTVEFEDDKSFATFVQGLYKSASKVESIGRGVTAELNLPPPGSEMSERNAEIIAQYAADPKANSSQKLADKHGITRERVCQILRPANVIAHAQERRAIAKAALKEAGEKLFKEVTEAMEIKLLEAVELCRNGLSQRTASHAVGFPRHSQFTYALAKRCRLEGIVVSHGRFKDQTARRQRIKDFAAANPNASPEQIVTALRGPEDPTLYLNWIYTHMPELKRYTRELKKSEDQSVGQA